MSARLKAFLISSTVSFIVTLSLLQIFSCKKEPLPKTDFFGEWITVTTGFKFEYSIRPDGKFCKKLPEFFNDEEFCCSYRQIGDTLFMFYPTREKWLYRFEEPNTDIMYVNNLLQNGSQPEYFILRRK